MIRLEEKSIVIPVNKVTMLFLKQMQDQAGHKRYRPDIANNPEVVLHVGIDPEQYHHANAGIGKQTYTLYMNGEPMAEPEGTFEVDFGANG